MGVSPGPFGRTLTAMVTPFTGDGERLVGQAAKRQAVTNPEHTSLAIKRRIGRRFEDPMTQQDMGMVPYKIVKADNSAAWVGGRQGEERAAGGRQDESGHAPQVLAGEALPDRGGLGVDRPQPR